MSIDQLNGQAPSGGIAPEPARNTFGKLPNQTMPKEWGDTFLQIVYDEYPAVFRAVLPRCAGLPAEQPKQRKARTP